MTLDLRGKTIALAVSGSIAAYKAIEVARRLGKAGARVIPLMTESATHFIGPTTLAGITGESVISDMFAPYPGEVHVDVARRADAIAIVPATADLLARLAHGRADDLVSALVLCARCPVVAAPAMHPRMWSHPATQRNVEVLRSAGRVSLIGPVYGEVASGEEGLGRLAEPEVIVEAVASALSATAVSGASPTSDADLAGRHVLVSAGPTYEDVDPVRFLGNRSSGQMGFALAEAAARRGARVTLVSGPVNQSTPLAVDRVDVRTAMEMREALWRTMGADMEEVDLLVMAAAVADYRVFSPSTEKIKKSDERLSLELVKNPDLLAEIGLARGPRPHPVLVGFALETGNETAVVAYARKKLETKKVDLVVANEASVALGGPESRVILVSSDGAEPLERGSKRALADKILDRAVALLRARSKEEG